MSETKAGAVTDGAADAPKKRLTLQSEEYAKVANKARLVEISLLGCAYDFKRDVVLDSDPAQRKHLYSGEHRDVNVQEDAGIVSGIYSWGVDIKVGRQRALRLRSDYFIAYRGLTDCDVDYVALYFRKVGRFASYPYFRANFSALVAASNIMMPPLPSLSERID